MNDSPVVGRGQGASHLQAGVEQRLGRKGPPGQLVAQRFAAHVLAD